MIHSTGDADVFRSKHFIDDTFKALYFINRNVFGSVYSFLGGMPGEHFTFLFNGDLTLYGSILELYRNNAVFCIILIYRKCNRFTIQEIRFNRRHLIKHIFAYGERIGKEKCAASVSYKFSKCVRLGIEHFKGHGITVFLFNAEGSACNWYNLAVLRIHLYKADLHLKRLIFEDI